MALVMALSAIAILTVMVADMHRNTTTAYVVAASERDRLQAEYAAKSALSLTRLLVANEPLLTQTLSPLVQQMIGRAPHQIPVWKYADQMLAPFCQYETLKAQGSTGAIDFQNAQGLGTMPGECQVISFAENSKINVSVPIIMDIDRGRRNVAMQLFALMGGYRSPSRYDELFSQRDAQGMITSRLDIVSSLIDWWDVDLERTVFDPGAAEVTSGGAEDNPYTRFDDPYRPKNAPLDSLEELRLVRGVDDDFWATFVERDPADPNSRTITIYGSGAVNPNEAAPEVMLARICSFIPNQPLCADPAEAAKFIQLVTTAQGLAPVPFFNRTSEFLEFLEGKGRPGDLYPLLQGYLGPDSELLFRPITIPENLRAEMANAFVTAARILSVYATGQVKNAVFRIEAVLNFHDRWIPPAPNTGTMPPLGIFHYYRTN